MQEFFQTYRVAIGFAVLVAYMLLSQRGEIAAMFSKIKLPSIGGSASPVADDDTADFQALARLQKRFERNKCKDGIVAVDTCLTHFFHREA